MTVKSANQLLLANLIIKLCFAMYDGDLCSIPSVNKFSKHLILGSPTTKAVRSFLCSFLLQIDKVACVSLMLFLEDFQRLLTIERKKEKQNILKVKGLRIYNSWKNSVNVFKCNLLSWVTQKYPVLSQIEGTTGEVI